MKSGTIHFGVAHSVAKLTHDSKPSAGSSPTTETPTSTPSVLATETEPTTTKLQTPPTVSVASMAGAVELTTTMPSTPATSSIASVAIAEQPSTAMNSTSSTASLASVAVVDSRTMTTSPMTTIYTSAFPAVTKVAVTQSSEPATAFTPLSDTVTIVTESLTTSVQDKSSSQQEPVVPIETLPAVSVILRSDNNNVAASNADKTTIDDKSHSQISKASNEIKTIVKEIKSDTPKPKSKKKIQQGSDLPVKPSSKNEDGGKKGILDSTSKVGSTFVKKVEPKNAESKVVRSSVLKDQGQSRGVTSDLSSDDAKEVKVTTENDQKKSSSVASSVEVKEQDENQSSSESKSKRVKPKTLAKPKILPNKNQSSSLRTVVKEGTFTLMLMFEKLMSCEYLLSKQFVLKQSISRNLFQKLTNLSHFFQNANFSFFNLR